MISIHAMLFTMGRKFINTVLFEVLNMLITWMISHKYIIGSKDKIIKMVLKMCTSPSYSKQIFRVYFMFYINSLKKKTASKYLIFIYKRKSSKYLDDQIMTNKWQTISNS